MGGWFISLEGSSSKTSVFKMLRSFFNILYGVGVVSASFEGNLNYISPSRRHPSLGVALHKVVKRQDPGLAQTPSSLNFTHGVASGDPYPDSVILWTRVAPTSDNDRSNVTVEGPVPVYGHETEPYVRVSRAPVCVEYKVGTDQDLNSVADSGTMWTSSDVDYTLKARATQWRIISWREMLTLAGGSQEPRALHDVLLPVHRL